MATSPRNVKLTWEPLAGRTVRIERSAGGEFVEIATRPGDRGRFLDLGLEPEHPYRYRLAACSDGGCTTAVETDTVTTPWTELPSLQITVPPDGTADNVVIMGILDLATALTEGHIAAVDRNGSVLWEYNTHEFGPVTELQAMPDGTLATGQFTTFIELDLDGSEAYRYTGNTAHHDIDPLSDDRVIFITFDSFETAPGYLVSGDGVEILSADRETVEWSWLARDHIPLTDVNEEDLALDNFGLGHDWTHVNALWFDEAAQKVYLNVRNLDRLYCIDYPSGEVDWIMGEGGDFGGGLWSHAHDPQFLEPGRLLMFDNGFRRPGTDEYSRVIEIEYDPVAGTAEVVWEYRGTPDFYDFAQGACHQEESGNVFVTDSLNGRVFEVTRDKRVVWELEVQARWIYKAITVPRSFFTEW